jgi:hypothetical protein
MNTIYKTPKAIRYIVIIAMTITASIAYLSWDSLDELWIKGVFIILLSIGTLSIADSFYTNVVITENEIKINTILKKLSIQKDQILNVETAKGCPVHIITKNDGNIPLPDLNCSPVKIKNRILKWTKS